MDSASLLSVEKLSGIAFAKCADRAWREHKVLLIGENSAVKLPVGARCKLAPGGGWYDGRFEPDNSDEIAQISSTSGTTGAPKAIAISRRAISNTVSRLIETMEMDSSIREYIAVPVTYSFGLGRLRAVAAVGGKSYLPDDDFRPDEIRNMLREGTINALSAVPTMLRLMITNPELIGSAGAKLRWLEIGSQHMSVNEKKKVRELFPNALILQHYGLTEASRSTFLRIDKATDDELGSIGQYIGDHGAVRIASDKRIEIKGPHVASGTITGKALEPVVQVDGWLRTNDLGEIRDGSLYFLGRADDVANISGIKVSAEHFEKQISELIPESAQVAACVLDDDLRGNKIGVAYICSSIETIRSAVEKLAGQLALRPADIVIAELDDFPRTETGKLRRKALASMIVAKKLQPDEPDIIAPDLVMVSPKEAEIAMIWQDALGLAKVGPNDSFHDLGGDSLSAVSVMIKAEQVGFPPEILQRMFAGETVAQIARALENEAAPIIRSNTRAIRADALNALRGLFALLIVISHWGPFLIDRMGSAGTAIWSFLGPLLRIGTPGFAMVYGMGLGFFFFGQIDTGRRILHKRIRKNTLLIFAGVLLIALTSAWSLLTSGTDFGPIWPERLFYEVLLFYALMVPTSLFWLRIVACTKHHILNSLLMAIFAYACYFFFLYLWPVNEWTGWVSLGWHMLVAPYAYPRLLGAVFLGLAAAIWLQRINDWKKICGDAAKLGLGLGIFGFTAVAVLPGGWTNNAGGMVAIGAFAGLSLLLYAGAVYIAASQNRPEILKLMIICGMIAFPIFIGHGLVFQLKAILEAYGSPTILAIAIPSLTFVSAMFWLGRRLYFLVFGHAKPSAKEI
ncbi:MAG: AMP-binding protein [Parasphingorhabdus sp.]|uniref:AMP-binding protein n=1 Tax=Parasphingorhabdus sp. TaxID=2709688 RepID=UPI003003644A